MKKILALVLACVMLASMFTVNAFAATLDIKPPVDINSGVPSFDPTTQGGDIQVKVEAVTHNYAIDIVYSIPTYTVPGVEWNVKTLKYDVNAVATNFDTNSTFTVTSYSDKDVNTSIKFVDADLDDGIDFEWKTAESKKLDAIKVNDDNVATTAAPSFTYELDVKCDNLVKTALYYYNKDVKNTSVPAANYTLTVEMPA